MLWICDKMNMWMLAANFAYWWVLPLICVRAEQTRHKTASQILSSSQQLLALSRPELPLRTMNRRFQWSYGGDGEAVRQALSAGRGHTGISHVYRPLSWQTSTRLQWEYRECSIMCFTESRLHEDVLDSVIQNNYILLHLYFFDVLSTLPDMGKIITHVSSKRTRTELLCAPMRRCLSPQSCMSA